MHVLERVEQGHEAAYILSRAARRAQLSPPEQAAAVDQVHGALRGLNRLDAAVSRAVQGEAARLEPWRRQLLRIAALRGEQRQPLDDLMPWADALARTRDRRRDARRQVPASAREAQSFLRAPPRGDEAEVALRAGHPAWFVGLARSLLGAEATALMAANNLDPPLVVRANTLKGSREALAAKLAEEGFRATPTRWSPLGLVVEPKQGAFRTRAFQEGRFEAQDEGSQLLALLAGAKPGMWVLDVCAGAGGKSLLLTAQMENKGGLVCLDTHAGRLLELKRRAARAGAGNWQAFVVDAQGNVQGSARAARRREPAPRTKLPRAQFDVALVDAPCSGLGTLRRTPELRWRHEPASLAAYPPQQRAILDATAPRVKPGGRLVYGTCSIVREENERVVEGFLAAHPEFALRDAAEALRKEVRAEGLTDGAGYLRLWPHRHGTEGFVAAVLQRAPTGS